MIKPQHLHRDRIPVLIKHRILSDFTNFPVQQVRVFIVLYPALNADKFSFVQVGENVVTPNKLDLNYHKCKY